ncbi:hypothetical protein NDU88_003583 [Pleurodeles waltl]|uniref:Uncharacterized protein n=1 Tax=Pleurodeles waltl TaxID=8319 RepID=A0AAV7M4F8_PLEWA|nr:hypothetical protein NDU88_003583 [Pleurodeles waltl]
MEEFEWQKKEMEERQIGDSVLQDRKHEETRRKEVRKHEQKEEKEMKESPGVRDILGEDPEAKTNSNTSSHVP